MLDDKGNISDKIMLVEKDKIVLKGKNNSEMMHNYFINITETVNLKSSKSLTVMISRNRYLNVMIM